MTEPLSKSVLDTLFIEARSYGYWQDKSVADETLEQLYDILKMGPTSMNSVPARFVFVKTPAAKARLKPALMEGNVDKAMSAPVTAIVAYDLHFHDRLAELFPHMDARPMFANNAQLAEETAFRNSSLQGAYLIIAARALGLDCGAMSGFDNASVDAAFFPEGRWKSNFLINLGYGRADKLYARGPRLRFEEACQIK